MLFAFEKTSHISLSSKLVSVQSRKSDYNVLLADQTTRPISNHSITKAKTNKHLMTGFKGNGEFCFPEILSVPQGEAEGHIEVEGKQN